MDDRKYAILYKFSFITEIAIELIFWHLKKISCFSLLIMSNGHQLMCTSI